MPRKKSNGEGLIRFREDKKLYEGRVSIGYDQYGKLKVKSVYAKRKSDVIEKMDQLKNDYKKESLVIDNKTTIYDLLKDYIDNQYKGNIIREVSYLRHLATLNIIKKLDIANLPIIKVNSTDISRDLLKLTDYSNSTISKVKRLISKAFNLAILQNLVKINPFKIDNLIIKIKSNKVNKKVEALTLEEQNLLLNELSHTDDRYKNVFYIALYTGMRIGEILALKKEDIDLKNKIIKVRKTITKDKNDKAILGETTKTYNSLRDVPIIKPLFLILSDLISKEDNYLFLYNNSFIDQSTINTHLKKICKNANIKVIINPNKTVHKNNTIKKVNLKTSSVHTHMLRHTFATRCIESGMNALVLSKILGHKNIEITLNVYTSVFNKFTIEEVNKINDVF